MNLLQDLQIVLEALKPSEYRKYVKGWDKNKYTEIFAKYATDKKKYRIYIPLKGEQHKVEPDHEVEAAVRAAGYEIEDYVTGIASKDEGKRKIKIGKLLKDLALQKKFANDPKRASSRNIENFVVISRHPYDIAGMSTDRGWRSCMNLHDGINRRYVMADVKEGSLVAYLVKADDKNINNPIARVLIKTFINVNKNAEEGKRVAFGVEDRVYGTPMPGFRETVEKWVNEINDSHQLDGIFEFNDNLYNDGGTKDKIGLGQSGKLYTLIKDDWKNIEKIENPSEEIIKMAIENSGGKAILYVKNPTTTLYDYAFDHIGPSYYHSKDKEVIKMIKAAEERKMLSKNAKSTILMNMPNLIEDLPDISDEDIIDAFYNNPEVMEYISNPSKNLQEKVIEENPEYIRYLKKQDPDVQMKVVEKVSKHRRSLSSIVHHLIEPSIELIKKILDQDPHLIEYFSDKDLDDETIGKVFEKHPEYFRYLKNPTDEQIKKALEEYPTNIEYVKNPTAEQILIAVKKDGRSIRYVPKKKITAEIAHAAVEEDESALQYVPDELHDEALHHKFLDKSEHRSSYARSKGHEFLKNATPAVQLRAIKQDPEWIQYINNPTEEVQMEAVKHNYNYIEYIENPSEAVMLEAVKHAPKGAMGNGYFMGNMHKPTKAVWMAAIDKFGGSCIASGRHNDDYTKIIGVDDDVVRKAMETYPAAIEYIEDPTPEDFEKALKKNHSVFRHMKTKHRKGLSKEIKKEVLKKAGDKAGDFFEYMSEDDRDDPELANIAIKSDPSALRMVSNPSEKQILLALNHKYIGAEDRSRTDYHQASKFIRNYLSPSNLTPKIVKTAVSKDHASWDVVKKMISRLKPNEVEKAGFTKSFMKEMGELAKGKHAEHKVFQKRYSVLRNAITDRDTFHSLSKSKEKTLVDELDQFISEHPKNFSAKKLASAMFSSSYLTIYGKELINAGFSPDKIYYKKYGEHVKYAYYEKKKLIGYIDFNGYKGYLPKKKINHEPPKEEAIKNDETAVKESVMTTFKRMFREDFE